MLTLADYKKWDSVYDTYMEPCQEYIKNTNKGRLYICKDRSNGLWEIKLNDKELFWTIESEKESKEKDVIKFIWKLYYNQEEN